MPFTDNLLTTIQSWGITGYYSQSTGGLVGEYYSSDEVQRVQSSVPTNRAVFPFLKENLKRLAWINSCHISRYFICLAKDMEFIEHIIIFEFSSIVSVGCKIHVVKFMLCKHWRKSRHYKRNYFDENIN